jgi:nitrate reductase NapE component
MAKNHYLYFDKVTLAEWVDKALLQSLKKETINSRFRVYGIWPLNLAAMVGKFGLSEVFIVVEEEGAENAY